MSALGAKGRTTACRICIVKLGVVTHTSNPSSQKAEAELCLAWTTEGVPQESGLQRERACLKKMGGGRLKCITFKTTPIFSFK